MLQCVSALRCLRLLASNGSCKVRIDLVRFTAIIDTNAKKFLFECGTAQTNEISETASRDGNGDGGKLERKRKPGQESATQVINPQPVAVASHRLASQSAHFQLIAAGVKQFGYKSPT